MLQVFWPIAHGNTSHCEQHVQVCTLRGEMPSGQDEVELAIVVNVSAANRNTGMMNAQFNVMVTFENSHGRSTATLTSNVGKQNEPII